MRSFRGEADSNFLGKTTWFESCVVSESSGEEEDVDLVGVGEGLGAGVGMKVLGLKLSKEAVFLPNFSFSLKLSLVAVLILFSVVATTLLDSFSSSLTSFSILASLAATLEEGSILDFFFFLLLFSGVFFMI